MVPKPSLEEFMRQMKDDVINRHDPSAAARYYANGYASRNPIPGRQAGLAGLTTALKEFLAAFPDAQETVEDVVASEDRVAAVGTIRATHKGAFAGIPPTGRRVTVHIFELHHVEAGKITGGWVFLDVMGLMAQIGTHQNPVPRA